jgi:hypothetical protein
MEKINTIIFSKDRACQLNLLLESMKKNIIQYNDLDVSVIWKSSTDNYKKGYDILMKKFPEINFISQSEDFKNDVLVLLNKDGYRYVQFGVDDDVVYGKYDMEMGLKCMENEDVFTYSPRLGKNTIWCHNLDYEHKFVLEEETTETIRWNWTKSYGDIGYPLTLDFGLFRISEIKKMIKTIGFTNPNYLEGNLASTYQYYFREQMAAPISSCVIGIPNNIVNSSHPNKHAEKFGITAAALNIKYLTGEIIDLNAMDFSTIKGCHQEIEYIFKKV